MEREVRTQVYRMAFVLFVFVALAAWQLEFVVRSVEANIYLNMTIICTFLFGAVLAFRSVLSLGNEIVALTALQVQYKSSGQLPEGCYDRPAAVYAAPDLLGHAHRLISDELTKPKKLMLPAPTVKMLVEGVDMRIDDRKSTLTYIVGLLVFLGLIGTFVGLMQTVGSVGDIIGSLTFGGEGGPSIDEAFQGLIADLKGPLVGMATGFSSSLFGLLCSLTLGLMERFGTAAHRILPLEFESWLTNVTQLDDSDNEGIITSNDDVAAKALLRVARLEARMGETASLARQSTEAVGELLVSVHAIAETMARDTTQTGFAALSDLAREMAHTQRGFMEQLTMIRELGESDRENAREVTSQISHGFGAMRKDRAAQDEILQDLQISVEKMATMQLGAPLGTAMQAIEAQSDDQAVANDDDVPHKSGLFGFGFGKSSPRGMDRQAKALRKEYHAMMREVLEKAFRRDTEIAGELEGIREAENRQDMTLEALVEHSRALQAQQRAVSGQVEVLAAILADERQDDNVLEEIRRSRLGLDLALRQISAQLSQTRETIETQALMQNIDHDEDQRQAG